MIQPARSLIPQAGGRRAVTKASPFGVFTPWRLLAIGSSVICPAAAGQFSNKPVPMKNSLRFLLPLSLTAALLALTSCQTADPTPTPAETNNHGKPRAAGTGTMQGMDHTKMKM